MNCEEECRSAEQDENRGNIRPRSGAGERQPRQTAMIPVIISGWIQ
jgi:hypothetical protein